MIAAMNALTFSDITDADIPAVIALWTRAGLTRPWNDPAGDIAFARKSPNATILVARTDGHLAATVMVGHDGHRGTVYYLGVEPDLQGHGYGRQAMAAAEAWLRDRGVWKLNLLVRNENRVAIGFYEALGYAVEPNAQLGKRFGEPSAVTDAPAIPDGGTLLITRALAFAARAHVDQRRKGARAEPYINHLTEVADLIAEATGGRDPALVAAALLHDTIEDTETSAADLAERFGADVAALVVDMTDDKSLPKAERKKRQISHAPTLGARAKMLKIADKISNMRSILTSPPADWQNGRIRAYALWGKAVIDGCRGISAGLEAQCDEAIAAILATYPEPEGGDNLAYAWSETGS